MSTEDSLPPFAPYNPKRRRMSPSTKSVIDRRLGTPSPTLHPPSSHYYSPILYHKRKRSSSISSMSSVSSFNHGSEMDMDKANHHILNSARYLLPLRNPKQPQLLNLSGAQGELGKLSLDEAPESEEKME